MGKASKWFKGLFGFKRLDPNTNPTSKKKLWIFAKSRKEKHFSHKSQQGRVREVSNMSTSRVIYGDSDQIESSYIYSLNDGLNRNYNVEWEAAIVIQSHFRAYLSRRALRALKALVKLQALVRGHIMRKQTADILRRMQLLVRAQQRARFGRSDTIHSSNSHNHQTCDERRSSSFLRNNISFQSDKTVLEVDRTQQASPDRYFPTPKRSSNLRKSHLNVSKIVDESSSKSDGSKSCLSGNYSSDQPSYMAYTESSRAKTRSLSAPKQRVVANDRYERSSSTNYRYSLHHGYNGESRIYKNIREVSALRVNLGNNQATHNYHGSGRLDRLGMPVRGDHSVLGFNGSYWN